MSSEKVIFGCEGVQKSYGKKQVLKGVSFGAPSGKIIGLFGANGTGKSTLFRILSGLEAEFQGKIVKWDFEDVAYMSVDNIYSPEMRVKDLVEFYKVFLPNQRTDWIYTQLQLAKISKNAMLSSLSTGMRQYVKFLLTLYSGASVCLFDEPLLGLDVNYRGYVTDALIKELNENRLFIIATHEIKEMETLIDGFYILKNGKLSQYYETDEVVEQTGVSIGEFYKEKINA
jgi:ABC-2 type transport system ATP-binding protein